jgi:F-type H+-transporting ATPase subunit b
MRASILNVFSVALLAAAAVLAARPCAAQVKAESEVKAAAADEHGEHAPPAADTQDGAGGPNPLAVDPDLAIWTAIVFLVLLFVLSKFAWPQISAALLEREKNIEAQIAAAAAKHEDAKRLLAEHEAKLAAAAGEVRALLEEARRDAEHTKNRIVAEARQAGEEEKARALREIERAKDGAIQELATASANVAIDLAKRVVRENITADQHTAVVREALSRLTSAEASKN